LQNAGYELTEISSITMPVYQKRSNEMSPMTDRLGNQPAAQRQTTTPRGDAVTDRVTIGSYLATRLEQIGLRHHFAVAGDYNLVLLDQLLLNKNLQ
jgi:hypothetical protein